MILRRFLEIYHKFEAIAKIASDDPFPKRSKNDLDTNIIWRGPFLERILKI